MNDSLVGQLPPPPRRFGPSTVVRAARFQLLSSAITMCGALFLAIGLIVMSASVSMLLHEHSLLRHGTATPGTVVGTYASTRRDRDGEHRVYQVEFRFLLPNGRSWTGLREVNLSTWNRLRGGDPLTVFYDPRDPSHQVLPEDRSNWFVQSLVGFAALLVVLGTSMLYFGARDILGALRLYRIGESVTGSIMELQVMRDELVGNRHPTRVVYTFLDRAGIAFSGAAKTLDDDFLHVAHRGSAVTVLYDRRRPARNSLLVALGLPMTDWRSA